MEPIDAWMEEELQRNDMHKNTSPLGVPADYKAPVKATIGAAQVTFHGHPYEDTYEVPAFEERGELYHSPVAPRKATSTEEALTAQIVNVIAGIDALPRDMVVLPEHYARFSIEPIRFVVENNLNFFQANIVKYIMRYDAKNGLEDLEKAQRYLTMFIKWVKKDPDWWKKG